MKLSKLLKEYFLGIKTNKSYGAERAFYREYITDEKDLKWLIKHSKIDQTRSVLGKIIPNLADLGAVVLSLSTQNPNYLWIIAPSEYIRLCSSLKTKKYQSIYDFCRSTILDTQRTCENIEGITNQIDRLNGEGEDWKKK